jgi:hypothetical protein
MSQPANVSQDVVTNTARLFNAAAPPGIVSVYAFDVQRRAADLAPYLRRMRRLKLAFLAR